MDEVNIRSGFLQSVLAMVIEKAVRQKTGLKPILRFNDPISVIFDGEEAKIHLNLNAELRKEDLQKLIGDLV